MTPSDDTEPGLLDRAPAWMGAVASAVGAAASSGALVVTPLFLAWLVSAASTTSGGHAVQVGIDVWLLVHGASLVVENGTMSMVPWLLTLVPFLTLRWAAQRVVAALPDRDRAPRVTGGLRRDVAVTGGAFVGAYVLVALLAAVFGRTVGVSAHLLGSLVGPFLLSLLAFALAVRRDLARRRGGDVAPRIVWAVREYVPAWVRRAVRPALVGTFVLLVAGMIGVLVLVGFQWSRVAGLYGDVGAGWIGGVILTLGQLCYLPTAGAWAVAFAAGPGFSLGTGSSITWTHVEPGIMPLVPLLGLLPDPGPLPPWSVAAVAVPAVVGLVVGWLGARRVPRSARWTERALTIAAAIALTAVFTGIVTALTNGALGSGRFAQLGASPWLVGAAVFGEMLLGGLLALGASSIRVRRRG